MHHSTYPPTATPSPEMDPVSNTTFSPTYWKQDNSHTPTCTDTTTKNTIHAQASTKAQTTHVPAQTTSYAATMKPAASPAQALTTHPLENLIGTTVKYTQLSTWTNLSAPPQSPTHQNSPLTSKKRRVQHGG